MIDYGIIAAGDGNRIKEEGSTVSKPLVEISGTPMIGRLISLMENCGAHTISVIVNSEMTDVWNYLQNLIPTLQCELKLISKKTPSSMHSFFELLKIVQPIDKYVVTTVDTIFREDVFKKYVDTFDNCPEDIDGIMGVTSFIDDEKPLYVETDKKDRIIGYRDDYPSKISHDAEKIYVSGGIYGLRKNSVPVLKSCVEKGLNRMRNFQRKLVESGLNLKAYDFGKVLDVDHLTDIEKANNFLA